MTPARRRLRTSRTLLKEKMMPVKPTLPTLRTLPSLRMMPARLTLLLSMPELMLKLLPGTAKTRLSATESTMRSETERTLLLNSLPELPYPPNFNKTPAKIIEPLTGASTCALGNHWWKKNIGNLTKKDKNIINKYKLLKFKKFIIII